MSVLRISTSTSRAAKALALKDTGLTTSLMFAKRAIWDVSLAMDRCQLIAYLATLHFTCSTRSASQFVLRGTTIISQRKFVVPVPLAASTVRAEDPQSVCNALLASYFNLEAAAPLAAQLLPSNTLQAESAQLPVPQVLFRQTPRHALLATPAARHATEHWPRIVFHA